MNTFVKKSVKQILDRKGYDVWSVGPDDTVFAALRFMAEKNIGAVVVVDNDRPVGIFSERDYARKVSLKGLDEKEATVRDVMTSQLIGVRPDYEIETCLALITGKFIRHLPVIDEEDRVIGVVSIGDLVKEIVDEQQFMLEQLVHYISGEREKVPVPEQKSVNLP